MAFTNMDEAKCIFLEVVWFCFYFCLLKSEFCIQVFLLDQTYTENISRVNVSSGSAGDLGRIEYPHTTYGRDEGHLL